MSRTQDDYGLTREKQENFAASHGTEPADPSAPDHAARRDLPLVPESVKLASLPDPLTADARPLTVAEARETYLRTQRASWVTDSRTSKYERHRYRTYPRILEADRHFREEYGGLTTAMVTRRLSPLDGTDSWLTPWECNEMLHGGGVHKAIRQALNYQLRDFNFEWVAVTSPTRSAGTPHEHIYLWTEDPDNQVTADHLVPALGKHLKRCPNAYEKHHRHRAGGTGGAITVEPTPTLSTAVPEKFFEITDESATYAESGTLPPGTAGAQYLASQLAHLPLADFYANRRENPPDPLIEGAALAWASPRRWFRASGGVPKLEVKTTMG